jgi:hypothetical protein
MSEDFSRLRDLASKVPFGLLVPVFYFLFFSSILLYAALSPLIYLYGMLCCAEVWIEWTKQGKDVLVIEFNSSHSREWMSRLLPVLSNRAVLINWSDREKWKRSALTTQLFSIFGPHGMPEQFTAHSLPAAIVFRTLRRPKVFTFGERSKDRDGKIDELRALLALPETHLHVSR